MASNFLEQLVAEWYEYQGYFVRRNVPVGKLAKGGYECELDVVGFHPEKRVLVHIEPSMDAASWSVREARYRKKFEAGRRHIPTLFKGLDLPSRIDQIAVLVFGSTRTHPTVGGGRVVLITDLLVEIFADLRSKHVAKQAIPENFPLLRTLQFVATYRNAVWGALNGGSGSAMTI